MNLHEEPSPGKVALIQHRVTPKELTSALAAIQARKQEAARRQEAEQAYLDTTIAVDEAVRELRLETTPEEIWAEVQVQRAAQPDEETMPEDDAGTEAVDSVSTDFSQTYSQVASASRSSRRRRWSFWQITSVLAATSAISLAVAFSHHHNSFPLAASTPFAHVTPSAFTVSNFPNGIPFELPSYNLDEILHGKYYVEHPC